MKSKSFNISKRQAFDICKRVLKDYECDIVSSDFATGVIEAKKGGDFLSYGHKFNLSVEVVNSGKVKISVSSNSVGIQIIDWGTNSSNEEELIEIISNSLR